MKKIVKQIPARISTTYRCEVCKTKYGTAKKAKECENRILEAQRFRVGDRVFNLEARCCNIGSKYFRVKMTVVKILGPMLPDYEYMVKWLGSYGLNGHIFQYEVEYTCPNCRKKHGHLYYTPEICKLRGEIPRTVREIRKIIKEQN